MSPDLGLRTRSPAQTAITTEPPVHGWTFGAGHRLPTIARAEATYHQMTSGRKP